VSGLDDSAPLGCAPSFVTVRVVCSSPSGSVCSKTTVALVRKRTLQEAESRKPLSSLPARVLSASQSASKSAAAPPQVAAKSAHGSVLRAAARQPGKVEQQTRHAAVKDAVRRSGRRRLCRESCRSSMSSRATWTTWSCDWASWWASSSANRCTGCADLCGLVAVESVIAILRRPPRTGCICAVRLQFCQKTIVRTSFPRSWAPLCTRVCPVGPVVPKSLPGLHNKTELY